MIDLLSILASELAISCTNSFSILGKGLFSSINMYVKIFLVRWKEILIYPRLFLFLMSTCSTLSPRLETEQSIHSAEDFTQIIINVCSLLLAEQYDFFSFC